MRKSPDALIKRFKSLIEEGRALNPEDVRPWVERARLAVSSAYGDESANLKRFDGIRYTLGVWTDNTPASAFQQAKLRGAQEAVAMLEAMAEDMELQVDRASPSPSPPTDGPPVFIVHGRDRGKREEVARLVQRLGLTPIILDEQTDRGQTVIEKFEAHALDVGYAIVLLTANDYGRGPGDESWPEHPNRARQNVVLELGYFMGSLGRARTAALYGAGTELPSDIHGMLYIPFDANWKLRLAKEMRDAGLPVDLNAL